VNAADDAKASKVRFREHARRKAAGDAGALPLAGR